MNFIDPGALSTLSTAPLADAGSLAAGAAGAGASALGPIASFANMLGPIGTAVQAVTGAVQGISQFASGMAQARQAKAAATQAEIMGGLAADRANLQGGAVAARAATLAAAQGGGLGGTTAGVLGQVAQRGYYAARMAAYRGVSQADADLYMSKIDKDNAINSLIGGFTGAGGQLVAGTLKDKFRQSILANKDVIAGGIDPTYALN
jgi:hypothetical protein